MKKNFSTSLSITLKVSIITSCMMCGFTVNAQSIVGKWKLTAAKEIITDNSTGKKQDVTAQTGELLQTMEQVIEFNSDNTYFFSNKMKGASKGLEVTGKYSVSGNQLKLQQGKSNMPTSVKSTSTMNNGMPPTVTISSVTGNTFTIRYGSTINEDGKNYTVDIIDTFTKQ